MYYFFLFTCRDICTILLVHMQRHVYPFSDAHAELCVLFFWFTCRVVWTIFSVSHSWSCGLLLMHMQRFHFYMLMQIHAHMLYVYCYMYVSLHVNLKIYTVLAQVLIIAFSYLMFVCQKLQLIK